MQNARAGKGASVVEKVVEPKQKRSLLITHVGSKCHNISFKLVSFLSPSFRARYLLCCTLVIASEA
jgi:hypothetical protein